MKTALRFRWIMSSGYVSKWISVIVLITMIDVFAKYRAYIVEHHSLHPFAI